MPITYSFSGNGNSTYAIGSLVDWHSSALIADQIQVLLNDVELVDGVGYEINEGAKTLELTSPASGSDTITLNRVTPDTFFSTLETVGAASATSTLSNDQQLMNRIQEVEADIVVASANTTIQDENGNLFGILKEGNNISLSYNAGDGSLTVSATGGGGEGTGGGIDGVDVDFVHGIGPQSALTSIILSSANTGFATTVVSDDLQAQINQLNTDLGGYVQTSGFNGLFDSRFVTQIADYEVKTISSPNGTLTITENGAGNFELETTGGQAVSSLQGQAGDLLMDMRVDGADTGVSNRIGLDGCSHDPTTPTFAGVTPAGTATGVEGWSWIHDLGAGSFVSHKPLSGTRDSELIGDKTLTLNGTVVGDTNNDLKVTGNVLVDAEHPTKFGHLMSQLEYNRQYGEFEWLIADCAVADDTNDELFLLDIGNGENTLLDPIGSGLPNARYGYPEDYSIFEATIFGNPFTRLLSSAYDLTGYRAPGSGDNATVAGSVDKLYLPGTGYKPILVAGENDPGPVGLEGALGRTTGTNGYFDENGITEPMPGSGNINRDAPMRVLNVDGFSQDSLGNVENKFWYRNFKDCSSNASKSVTDKWRARSGRTNGSTYQAQFGNVIYIPGSNNGGLVTIEVEVAVGDNQVGSRVGLVMFTGLDEANKKFGDADTIIPVSAAQRADAASDLPLKLKYTYDNSDGFPRYFGILAGGDASVEDQRINRLSIRRGKQSEVLGFSPLDSDLEDTGGWVFHTPYGDNVTSFTYGRMTYEPSIAKLVSDNHVPQ